MAAGRRGGIRCSEGWKARMPRSRPPIRMGMRDDQAEFFHEIAAGGIQGLQMGDPLPGAGDRLVLQAGAEEGRQKERRRGLRARLEQPVEGAEVGLQGGPPLLAFLEPPVETGKEGRPAGRCVPEGRRPAGRSRAGRASAFPRRAWPARRGKSWRTGCRGSPRSAVRWRGRGRRQSVRRGSSAPGLP